MLNNDLIAKAADSSANRTFSLVRYLADGSQRLANGSSLTEPITLTIRHSTAGNNGAIVDRHLIQVSQTEVNSAGKPVTMNVNLTFTIPRDAAVSMDDAANLFENLVSLFATSEMLATGMASGPGNPGLLTVFRGAS